jgi:anti-sigma-K factor RskA
VAETDRDELDALAGEYVLGTLGAEERRAAEARLAADPAFEAAVAAWEGRLQPLADAVPAVEPPGLVLDRVLARIDGLPGVRGENIVRLHRAVQRWQLTAAVMAAAASILAGVVVLDLTAPPVRQSEYVAVLTSEGAAPKFVASINLDTGMMSLRRVDTGSMPPDKSYELWAIEPGQAPKSMGLVEGASLTLPMDHAAGDLTLAISLEPKGGSTTGAPTGPVMFSGTLVATE